MRVQLAEPGLESLDRLRGDCLVLTAFTDDRPLRGLAGRVDWRLCGRLSSLMIREFLTGELGEVALVPMTDDRLQFDRLLIVGLGRRAEFDPTRFEAVCATIFKRAAGIGIRDLAMAMPGRVGMDIGLRQAVAGWARGIVAAWDADALLSLNLTLLEPAEFQRELAEPIADVARRIREEAARATGRELDAAPVAADETEGDHRGFRTGVRRLPSAPEPSSGVAEF